MSLPVGLHIKVSDLASRGLYEEALEVLRVPLAQHPDHPDLLTMAGRCALELGHGDYALRCFEFARTQRPDDVALARELGCGYRRCGRYDHALELFETVGARHPFDAQWLGQRGLTYLARGDRRLAEADLRRCLVRMYDRAREMPPEELEVVNQALAALRSLGIEFPVPSPDILRLMRLRDVGDHKELIAQCTAQLKRPSAWLHFLRGCARVAQDSHREAIEDLTKALEMEPDLIQAYRYRGDAYAKVDRHRAASDYHKFLELGDPREPVVLGNLGMMYFHLRRIDDALSPLETSVELLPPDDGALWETLGRCYLGVGRHADALRAFNQAVSKGGASPEMRYLRGTVLEQLGAREQAINEYQAYLAEMPKGAAAGRAKDRLANLGPPPKKGFLRQLFGKE